MKQITCKSGLRGWQGHLHEVYKDFDEFESYCMTHQIHVRLGYRSIQECWIGNPLVQGSVNPSDLRRVNRKSCHKCGSPLRKGYCVDETCSYHDHEQGENFTEG